MKVSTKGRYALRIMLELASYYNADEYVTIKQISMKQDITIKYMEQIVALLNKAGYVKSLRGNSGGYRLAMPPEKYTIGDILRVTEGNLTLIACLSDEVICPRSEDCKSLPFWNGLYKVMNDYADSITLRDLLI